VVYRPDRPRDLQHLP